MSFDSASAYDRFMGRYSRLLAPQLADLAGVGAGARALDVGSGPGELSAELVRRGADVTAIDPSPPFVEALQARLPGVQASVGSAESLPFADDAFEVAIAQLVVHFMADPVAGLREMGRVSSGVVAACVWDHAGARTPLAVFWAAANELFDGVRDESTLNGAREGHLAELFAAAGLEDIESTVLEATVQNGDFEDWWEPFTLGVGPGGDFLKTLDADATAALKERCRELLPETTQAAAWAVRGYKG
jgi:ubiquinone/menaquinone biosynthesis C-methylase UbiE